MSAVTAQLVFAFVSHSKTKFSLDEGHMISRNFTTYPEQQQKEIYSSSFDNKLPSLSKMHYFQTYVNMKATYRTRQSRENVSKLIRRQ